VAYALKSTGIAANLIACLLVDEDGSTIVDLCGNTISTHASLPAVGTATWKGTSRKHIVTSGDGSYTPYGVTWTGTKPNVGATDADGFCVFVAAAGASADTGGVTNPFVHIDADPHSSPDRGLYRNTADKAVMAFGGSSGGVSTTSIPTDGTTKFSMAGNWKNDANVQVFYGLESGSLAADSTAVNPGVWGSTTFLLSGIGGMNGQGTQPFKPFVVAVFDRELTLTELQSLHGDGTNDWFSTLIDAGSPAAELAGTATASATATGDLTTTPAIKGVSIQLGDGTPAANLTGLSVRWWDASAPTGAPDYQSDTETTDASGWLEIDLTAVTALAIGANGYLHVFKAGATPADDIVAAGRVPVSDIA
jgi:hypothetical protein